MAYTGKMADDSYFGFDDDNKMKYTYFQNHQKGNVYAQMYRWAKFGTYYHHVNFRIIAFDHVIWVPITDVINHNFHI